MKTIILMALVFSGSLMAQVPRERVEKFLFNSPCFTAVGRVLETKAGKDFFMSEVLCVTEAMDQVGTIKERSGCALVIYNMNNNTVKGTNRDAIGRTSIVMSSKRCKEGGFKDLLQMETISGSKIKVIDSLKTGKGTYIQPPERLVDYKGMDW